MDDFSQSRIIIYIDDALDIFKHRFTTYIPTYNNKQFSTIYKNNNVVFKNRLNELLSYFTTKKDRIKIFNFIKTEKDDTYILNFLKRNYKLNKNRKKRINLFKISKIVNQIHKILVVKNNVERPKILDLGTGNGKKIKMIRDLIDCEIYGADIKAWGPYIKSRNIDFTFKFIKENPYKIPYSNKKFDCITIILALHHCDDIITTIKECKRILKDDGIIIIIEHDIWDDNDNMIIDLQHRIYRTIFNEPKEKDGDYYNFLEWDMIFYKCGMKPIYGDRISDDVSFKYRYDLQFIGIYKKKL